MHDDDKSFDMNVVAGPDKGFVQAKGFDIPTTMDTVLTVQVDMSFPMRICIDSSSDFGQKMLFAVAINPQATFKELAQDLMENLMEVFERVAAVDGSDMVMFPDTSVSAGFDMTLTNIQGISHDDEDEKPKWEMENGDDPI